MRLIFPASAPAGLANAGQRPALPPLQPSRILVVDDDPVLLRSLRNVLETDQHQVTVADGGRAGIEAFLTAERNGQRFAVVITDLGMPYVDGRQVAAAIKTASPATPVIMLTGWGRRMITENEMPEHIDRLLSKPPKIGELRMALAEVTAGSSQTTA